MTTQTEIKDSFWQAFPQFAPERRGTMKNRKRRTPIPGLAEHISGFTGKARKTRSSAFLARLCDRLWAISLPKTRERL